MYASFSMVSSSMAAIFYTSLSLCLPLWQSLTRFLIVSSCGVFFWSLLVVFSCIIFLWCLNLLPAYNGTARDKKGQFNVRKATSCKKVYSSLIFTNSCKKAYSSSIFTNKSFTILLAWCLINRFV